MPLASALQACLAGRREAERLERIFQAALAAAPPSAAAGAAGAAAAADGLSLTGDQANADRGTPVRDLTQWLSLRGTVDRLASRLAVQRELRVKSCVGLLR